MGTAQINFNLKSTLLKSSKKNGHNVLFPLLQICEVGKKETEGPPRRVDIETTNNKSETVTQKKLAMKT